MRWAGYAACMEEKSNEYKILVEKPEGKRSCGSSIRRCEDNIKMFLRETRWEGVDWMHLPQVGRALVNTVINLMRFHVKW
jgi:hypothetical protein